MPVSESRPLGVWPEPRDLGKTDDSEEAWHHQGWHQTPRNGSEAIALWLLRPESQCSAKEKRSKYTVAGPPPSGDLSIVLGSLGGNTWSGLWHFSCGVPGVVGLHLREWLVTGSHASSSIALGCTQLACSGSRSILGLGHWPCDAWCIDLATQWTGSWRFHLGWWCPFLGPFLHL